MTPLCRFRQSLTSLPGLPALLALLALLVSANGLWAEADPKPLTPAEAAQKVSEKVTVEFAVKGTVSTSAGLVYLYSEMSFKEEGCFLVRFSEAAQEKFKKLNIPDVGKHFKGSTVRVTGTVKVLNFASVGKRPAIDIDEVSQIEVVGPPAVVAKADNTTEKPILVLDAGGHTDMITRVVFSPDGRQMISVSKDKTVRIWNVSTGECTQVLRPPIGPGIYGSLYAVAVSPDGKTLAIGGVGLRQGETDIFLITLGNGQIVKVLKRHKDNVHALAFSPDGKWLASAGRPDAAYLWNLASGQCIHELEGHRHPVFAIVFSPDSRKVATGADGGRIFSVDTGKLLAGFPGHQGWVGGLDWSRDGRTIVSGGPDQAVRVWNADGTPRESFEKLGNGIQSVTLSTDASEVLLARGYVGTTFACSILNLQSGKERLGFSGHNSRSTAALSPDGKLAASGGFIGSELYIWSTSNGAIVHRLSGQGRVTWSTGWSTDSKSVGWGNTGKYHFTNDRHPLERSFHLENLELVPAPGINYMRAQESLNGLNLFRPPPPPNSSGAGIYVYVKESDKEVARLGMPLVANWPLCYTLLTGDRVIVGAVFGLYQYDARTGQRSRSYQGHTGNVWAVSPSPDNRYLATGANDQTLSIWTPDRDQPLLSLFFAGNEWIAWTPEGYYAASAGGEKLMGWQVNNGPDKLGSFYPAAQFHKTFYRPDVIKRLLETGSVEKALVLADKERGGQQTRKTEVAQVLPPKVTITYPPTSGQKITATKFEIKTSAISAGQHPVTSLRLLVDGRPYGGDASLRTVRSATVGEVKESWQVELPPGTHRLAVVAASAVSQGLSDEIEIIVAPATSFKPPTSGLHLLAIGINAYPGRMKLDCAVPDARAIDQAFRTHSKGIYNVQSTLLLDKDATRANVLKGIAQLEKQAKPGDVAIVYYAGHGDCKLVGQFVMLTIDASVSREKLAQTGVTGEEVKARLAKLPCTVLLIMDCCYAGSFDAPGKKKRALPTEAGDLVRDSLRDDLGLVVMCGASKEQESGEETKLGHGYFTLALTEGLAGKGGAVSRLDGRVYLSGLQKYVEERVRELSKDEQFPTIGIPSTIRSFPLSKP